MKFVMKPLGIEAGGKSIVVMDDEAARALGVHPLDRVEVVYGKNRLLAILNVALNFPRNTIGVYEEVRRSLQVKEGEEVEVRRAEKPESLSYIREKISGRRLSPPKIRTIVRDVVEQRLSDVELTSFVTALQIHGTSIDEVEALTRAMVDSGKTLDLDQELILDKHSIGGVPGDKTTILVVPIVAAAGFTIPKTSSRAITSPAGTADRVEVLCPVDLSLEEIQVAIAKTNACMVWGGALDLAPADDLFIKVEYPLSIDPLLLSSIMSKKKAVGAKYVVIDIPAGRGTKSKTIGGAHELAGDFIELGKRLGIRVECAVTFGEQPIGYAIGPALEAKEALNALMGNGPKDLKDKSTTLAGILFGMTGIKDGKQEAAAIIESGRAEKKLREIIEAQGGDPNIKPQDIKIGDRVSEILSKRNGRVLWINNRAVAQIAMEAGAPKDKGAGVLLKSKIGDRVTEGDVLFQVYAEISSKLESAIALAEDLAVMGVGERFEEKMLIDRIPTKAPHERVFALDR